MNPIVVTYYTDAKYRHLAARLAKSCDRRKIPCQTLKAPDLGSWQKNTHQKPKFILRMLNTYKNCQWVMWVDADAVVRGKLALVEGDYDVAVYRFRPTSLFHGEAWHNLGQLFNGTLLFRNSEFSREVLREWARENKEFPGRLDQKNLASVLARSNPSRIRCLPPEYCWIERLMRPIGKNTSPVIVHEARAMDGLRGAGGRWNRKLSSPPLPPSRKVDSVQRQPTNDGRELLWAGHLYDLSGYAKANRELLFRVSCTYRTSILSDYVGEGRSIVDELTRRRVDAHLGATVSKSSPLLRFYVPVTEAPGRKRICFTMMETELVHRGMVDSINRNYSNLWTPTRWNADSFKKSGVRVPVSVVPLGVNPAVYSLSAKPSMPPADLMTTTSAGKSEKPRGFVFLYVCQPTFRKGIPFLVEAFSKAFKKESVSLVLGVTANDHQFFLCDPFSRAGRPESIKTRIYKLGGNYSEEEMAGIFRASDAYVCTSIGEGWNLPLTEAAACGVPVIAPRHTSHLEFLTDDNSSLFDPDGTALYPEGDPLCKWYVGQRFARYGKRSLDQLVHILRGVYNSYGAVRKKAEILGGEIRSRYTWDSAASIVIQNLDRMRGGI